MTLDDARSKRHCILEAVTGSRAYGTDLPNSDTDIKGIFIQPAENFYGLYRVEQINNETNDIVFYEIGRFVELLIKGNPGALELLCSPKNCILHQDEVVTRLKPEIFFSRQCFDTFAGYAAGQIKKAYGLNKKILNPMPEARPSVLDFCYVLEGQGSISLNVWLKERDLKQTSCGLVAIPHMRDVYGLYYDASDAGRYHGILSHVESTEVSLSSVDREDKPIVWMSFNKDGYKKCVKDWRAYWDWVLDRNEARYEGTLEHGKNYDAKNMMHTFRLLEQAQEIGELRTLSVKTKNRDFLMSIRRGEYEYQDLVKMAENRLDKIKQTYDASDLPEKADAAHAEAILVEIRSAWYES